MDQQLVNEVVFWAVVAARFFVPLAIPRYPLPAILAAAVIDGVDQTVFQAFTTLDLTHYQGYDKALDIYYLTIAYISTMRNWTHLFAYQAARFLYYWRMFGVVAFELTQIRPLLLIFPNTFEYFFYFYEAYRSRWDPRRMSQRYLIGAIAFIWIFIKLPQEWWLHIAQLDMTDTIKTLLGGAPDTAWSELLAANLWLVPAAVVLVVAVWWLCRWVLRTAPPKDWGWTLAAPALPGEDRVAAVAAAARDKLVDRYLVEKIVMVSLISIIFAQVLPGVQASNLQLSVAIAYVIVVNTFVSQWLARRGVGWESALREFAVMFLVNAGAVVAYDLVLENRTGAQLDLTNTVFFLLLLTLLVVLYDRYLTVHRARFADDGEAAPPSPGAAAPAA